MEKKVGYVLDKKLNSKLLIFLGIILVLLAIFFEIGFCYDIITTYQINFGPILSAQCAGVFFVILTIVGICTIDDGATKVSFKKEVYQTEEIECNYKNAKKK